MRLGPTEPREMDRLSEHQETRWAGSLGLRGASCRGSTESALIRWAGWEGPKLLISSLLSQQQP